MQDYVYSLLLVAVIGLLCELLMPTRSEGVRRAVSFGIALFSLLILARPLTGLSELSFQITEELPSFSERFEGSFAETEALMAEAVGEGIAEDLAAHFGLSAAEITAKVTLSLEGDDLCVSSLSLSLTGGAQYADHIAVAAYAKAAYQITGEVLIHGGK